MFRITNAMLYNNNLFNVFTNNKGMLTAQEQLASGKRINRPSDDAAAFSQALGYRNTIRQNKQFIQNIDDGLAILDLADASLNTLGELASKAKEIAISQTNATADSQTRRIYAQEIDGIIGQVLNEGNKSYRGSYIFAGKSKSTQPFASGAVYYGSKQESMIEVFENTQVGVALDGSEAFASDLNPTMTTSTTLTSLNRGQGVAQGSFSITDRSGSTSAVNLASANTIGDVITLINGSGANVTATINSSQNGITITDNTSPPTNNLVISEIGGGSTASAFGLLSDRGNSVATGFDLDPGMTGATTLAQLNDGAGLSLTSINVLNGAASGTVSFAGATTVNDVLNAINSLSGVNITASINSSGTAIDINSNDPATNAYALEVGTGTSAMDLGISGGGNLIKSLMIFRDALLDDDSTAIQGSIDMLGSGLDRALAFRGKVGARTNRLESAKDTLIKSNDDTLAIQSTLEDADMIKAVSDLARFQTAYQATLQSSAKIMQATLMDFLR